MATLRNLVLLAGFPLVLSATHCGGESSSPAFQGGGANSGTSGDAGGASGTAGGSGAGGTAGTSGAAGAAGSTGTPLSDVPATFAPAFCETAAQCYGPLLKALLGGNSCTGFLTKQLEQGDFSLLADAVAKGTVVYDGTKIAACIDALRKKGCSILSTRTSEVCADALHGTIAAGQPCTFNGECTAGLFCKTTTCPGVCTALLAEGAACEGDNNCQDGLTCNDKSVCAKAVVLDVTGAEGDACDPTAAKFCQDGLFCAAVSVATGAPAFRCETAPATGCHVAFPEECPDGQFCKLANAAQSLVGTCTAVPKAGEPCGKPSPGDSRNICAAGTTCDAAAGNCVAFQDNGGSCTGNPQCYSKSCSAAGACVPSKCAN